MCRVEVAVNGVVLLTAEFRQLPREPRNGSAEQMRGLTESSC
jgi:hypothetical protein